MGKSQKRTKKAMPKKKKSRISMRRVIASSMIGNALECYDYALYAQMSFILSTLFFPGENQSAKLLATFGVFAMGFLFRPLGAVLFGYIGDRFGRRIALVSSILLMAIPTGCIGLLPTYEQAGLIAPLLLTLIRALQGLSLGGEFSGSIIYMVEHAPKDRRGIAGAAAFISLIIGFLLGSLVTLAFVHGLNEADFQSWGWRIPFLLGAVIGLIGLYIRSSCSESPAYQEAKSLGLLAKKPLRTTLASHKSGLLLGFLFYASVTVPFYLSSVYFITFNEYTLGLTVSQSFTLNIISMLLMMTSMAVGARVSDSIGRKPVMLYTLLILMVSVYPLFFWMESGTLTAIALAQFTFALIAGFYISPIPTVLVELFPTPIRYTGMALSYNLAASLLGGTTPMICQWLIQATGTYHAIPIYVIFWNILTLIALLHFKDAYRGKK